MKPPIVFIACFSLLLLGCDALEQAPSPEATTPMTWDARIVPGLGVDSVRLGDTREAVLATLGPTNTSGFAEGINTNWIVFDFRKGSHAGLSVWHIENPINTPGPVDLFTLQAPYAGTSKEGIGIGASPQEVAAAFGEPASILDRHPPQHGSYSYTYCIHDNRLTLSFSEDRVEIISMGYFQSSNAGHCP